MAHRIVLHSGKGGAGTTAFAAATAVRAARGGTSRSLLLSAGGGMGGDGLGRLLGAEVGDRPVQVSDGLWAEVVAPRAELERAWAGACAGLAGGAMGRGARRIAAEELPIPPGADEVATLLRLHRHAQEGEFDVLVVDLGPLAAATRLLALPDLARWWLRRAVREADTSGRTPRRPFARVALDVAMGDDAPGILAGIAHGLLGLNDVLRDRERTTLRLVTSAEDAGIAATRRALTALSLHGFPVDAVIANRLLPGDAGPTLVAARARATELVDRLAAELDPLPVLRAGLRPLEVVGLDALGALADDAFGALDPLAVLARAGAEDLELDAHGAQLRLPLPLARREEVSLRQVGEDLVVRVDGQQRTVALPAAVRGFRASAAALRDGTLHIDLAAPPAEATA